MNQLLLKFIYKFGGRHMFSFLFGKNLGMKWLGHKLNKCLILCETAKVHSKEAVLVYISIIYMN